MTNKQLKKYKIRKKYSSQQSNLKQFHLKAKLIRTEATSPRSNKLKKTWNRPRIQWFTSTTRSNKNLNQNNQNIEANNNKNLSRTSKKK